MRRLALPLASGALFTISMPLSITPKIVRPVCAQALPASSAAVAAMHDFFFNWNSSLSDHRVFLFLKAVSRSSIFYVMSAPSDT
jgi:hypothetical protein